MPPNESTSARESQDHHALAATITAIGTHQDRVRYRLARLNGIGLHWDSQYCGPPDNDGNVHIMPEEYRLAGIGLALL